MYVCMCVYNVIGEIRTAGFPNWLAYLLRWAGNMIPEVSEGGSLDNELWIAKCGYGGLFYYFFLLFGHLSG